MKVLLLIETLEPGAGMERMATSLANELHRRGHRVDFAVLGDSAESYFEVEPGIGVFPLGTGFRRRWAAVRALRRLLRGGSYDRLINVGVPMGQVSLPACAGIPGIKVVTWEHFGFHAGSRLGRVWRMVCARWSWRTVVLTSGDRDEYLAHVKAEVADIGNFATLPVGGPAPLESCEVLAVGRLMPQKGFDMLLDAWARVAAHGTGWTLRIVGSGAGEEALKSQAARLGVAGSVVFTPATASVGEYYRRASLLVMSSRFEGLPMVLIEARMAGLPCVSFDCPKGPSHIIRDGVDGTLVPPGDTDALADALLGLMADREKMRRFGRLGREDALARFGTEEIVGQWESLLAEGCKERHSAAGETAKCKVYET